MYWRVQYSASKKTFCQIRTDGWSLDNSERVTYLMLCSCENRKNFDSHVVVF